jgi:hypothetical protein
MSRIVIALLAALMLSGAAHAITHGEPDDGAHPYVGQLLLYVPDEVDSRFTDPGAWFNCSGTLISPTVVVTAGHCVHGIGLDGGPVPDCTLPPGSGCGNDVWINFSDAPDYAGFPPSADYIPDGNQARYVARAAFLDAATAWVRGRAYVHPEFADGPFLLHDVGVVVLSEEVTMPTYGVLPTQDYLDRYLATRRNEQRFTPVGYGLTRALPIREEGGDTREKASTMLVTLKGQGLPAGTVAVFSNNNGAAHRGGSCFGDSGGPIFDGATNQIVAINSYGVSPNCTGFDGTYRIDQPDDIDFLEQFEGP